MPVAPTPNWPYYELPSAELAAWVERQPDMWWMVDGDPLLTGRVSFPCPTEELAADLRALNRPLLVRAAEADAAGQPVDRDRLDGLTSWLFGSQEQADRLAPDFRLPVTVAGATADPPPD